MSRFFLPVHDFSNSETTAAIIETLPQGWLQRVSAIAVCDDPGGKGSL
jgi:hypothetical protein